MRTNSADSVSCRASWFGSFFEKLPDKTINNAPRYNRLGHALASPHWNRLALGGAAILTQPAFDVLNPRVDNDTAVTSALRTGSKIVVCTTVGFIVRGTCYKLVNKFLKTDAKGWLKDLIPNKILTEENPVKKEMALKIHKNTISTLSALCVMIFTNFLLDAPGATLLANKCIKAYNNRQAKKEAQNEKL